MGCRVKSKVALQAQASCHILKDTEGVWSSTCNGKPSPTNSTSPCLSQFRPLDHYNSLTSNRSPWPPLSCLSHPSAPDSPTATRQQNLRGRPDTAPPWLPSLTRGDTVEGIEAPVLAPDPGPPAAHRTPHSVAHLHACAPLAPIHPFFLSVFHQLIDFPPGTDRSFPVLPHRGSSYPAGQAYPRLPSPRTCLCGWNTPENIRDHLSAPTHTAAMPAPPEHTLYPVPHL